MSGGASFSGNKSRSESGPWAGQQPYLADVFRRAKGLNDRGAPGYYPGATYTPFNELQQDAMAGTLDRSGGSAPEGAMSNYLTSSMQQPQFDLGFAGQQANQAAGGMGAGQQALFNQMNPYSMGMSRRQAGGGMSPWQNQMRGQTQYGGVQDVADFVGQGPGQAQDALTRLQSGIDVQGAPGSQGYVDRQLSEDPTLAGRIGDIRSAVGTDGVTLDPTARAALSGTAEGNYLNANPYLDEQFGSASRAVSDQFKNTVMPGINATFGAAGRTGSGIQQEMIGDAGNTLAQTLGDMGSQIYGDNYARERQNQMDAAGKLGSLDLQAGTTRGRFGLEGAGLGADVYKNDAARQLGAAGLGSEMSNNLTGRNLEGGRLSLDAAGVGMEDQRARAAQAIQGYLSERELGQSATQAGAGNQLQQNQLMADMYSQGQNRALDAGGAMMQGGMGGIDSMANLYQQIMQSQQGAASMVPAMSGLDYQNLDAARGVGNDVQGLSDRMLQDQMDRYNYQQQAPYDMLQKYASIIMGQDLTSSKAKSSGWATSGYGGMGAGGGTS